MPAAAKPVISAAPWREDRDPDEVCTVEDCGHPYYRHFDYDVYAEDDEDPHIPNCKYCPCGSFNNEQAQKPAQPGTGAHVVTFTAAGVQHVAIVTDISDVTERFGPDAVAVPVSIDGPATPLPAPQSAPTKFDEVSAEELHIYLDDLHERVTTHLECAAATHLGSHFGCTLHDLDPERGLFKVPYGGDSFTIESVPMTALHPGYAARREFMAALAKTGATPGR